jgi:hypothetical protein
MIYLAFFLVALVTLLGLTAMILRIGRALGECPSKGRAAQAASITIATGFVAIGLGGVSIIAAGLAMADAGGAAALFAVGLACVTLGLGFTHAVTLLRETVSAAPVPMEPVLAGV